MSFLCEIVLRISSDNDLNEATKKPSCSEYYVYNVLHKEAKKTERQNTKWRINEKVVWNVNKRNPKFIVLHTFSVSFLNRFLFSFTFLFSAYLVRNACACFLFLFVHFFYFSVHSLFVELKSMRFTIHSAACIISVSVWAWCWYEVIIKITTTKATNINMINYIVKANWIRFAVDFVSLSSVQMRKIYRTIG